MRDPVAFYNSGRRITGNSNRRPGKQGGTVWGVGFIGLGNMGAPLARQLIGAHQLVVYDHDPAVLAGFGSTDVIGPSQSRTWHRVPRAVLTCLPTSAHLEALLFGEQALATALEPGTLVIDMTTGDPSMTRELASRLQEYSIELIDAPVSGGPRGAGAGTIAIIGGRHDPPVRTGLTGA
ncbi:MAG: hypothetical protein CM1200mP20_13910 [Pseudomonadota bacterium]|nr:MAG: hypothetical protein CM1200mP20_13910 [Pseudomonadota bacterium]